jgi:hypothetical protein
MSADMSGEQMQAKITAARREAEGLKDRIKRKKDDLADTTRELSPRPQKLGVMAKSSIGEPHDHLLISCSI